RVAGMAPGRPRGRGRRGGVWGGGGWFPSWWSPRVAGAPPFTGVNSTVPCGTGLPLYITVPLTGTGRGPPVQAGNPTRRAPTRTTEIRTERFIGEAPPTGADAGPEGAREP